MLCEYLLINKKKYCLQFYCVDCAFILAFSESTLGVFTFYVYSFLHFFDHYLPLVYIHLQLTNYPPYCKRLDSNFDHPSSDFFGDVDRVDGNGIRHKGGEKYAIFMERVV